MNYAQALQYLNSFVNYEKTPPKSHAELNLERMRYGLALLDHPEENFFPVLIAGTVGKGSTGFLLEQIFKASKTSVGYYHSPHVADIRERIRINGEMVSEKIWAAGLTDIQKRIKQNPLPKKLTRFNNVLTRHPRAGGDLGQFTYFEILTLLAIKIFSDSGLQAGIFEIGMGGRLDATNVLDAPVCILTKIDFDHEQFLGKTIAKIAAEKAGIIKNAPFVVSCPQQQDAMRVIKKAIAGHPCKLITAKPVPFQPGLLGEFQKQNAGNAATAAKILRDYFLFPLTKKNIQTGLRAKKWPGRIEIISYKKRKIILDAAHNPAGCYALIKFMKKENIRPAIILFGALRDKKSPAMLKELAVLRAPAVMSSLQNPRSKSAHELAQEASGVFDTIFIADKVRKGFQLSLQKTRPGDSIVVTGSFYLVGEVSKWIK